MPVNKKNLICVENVPPATDTGIPQRVYYLVTNDNKAAVEADGYFDGVLENGLNIGDVIHAVMDRAGTPLLKIYLVTAGGADVAIKGLGLTVTALTDNSGGVVSGTIAAISDTATKNAIASINAKLDLIRAVIGV